MAEGIIFGEYFLDENQFKAIFKEWYSQKKINLLNSLNSLINSYENILNEENNSDTDYKELYNQYVNFQKEYFGNDEIKLQAIIRKEKGSNDFIFSKLLKESDFLENSKRGALLRLNRKNLKKSLESASRIKNFQKQMNNHYSNLRNLLSSHILDKKEAELLHRQVGSRARSKSENTYRGRHFSGKSYYQNLFERSSGGEGKIFDAYINHIAEMHYINEQTLKENMLKQIISSLKKASSEDEFKQLLTENTKNFQNWLLDSLNTTPWYRSGDVVVVGESGQIVYNVQLKSSQNHLGEKWVISFTDLFNKLLIQMKENIENPEELANLMYKELRTNSSNSIEFKKIDEFIESEAYGLIKKNLGLNIDKK